MPIYEYKCLDCGEHLEKMQKVSDETLKICEKCGGKLEKQWSRSGFQFKGEGWYVSEYGKKSHPPETKSTETTKTDDKSTTETTTKTDNSASKETAATTTTISKTE